MPFSYQFMSFRDMADLERAMHTVALEVPGDVELVVGVPRSGLLAASILALQLNLPLTDVAGFLEGRTLGKGHRPAQDLGESGAKRVVVVDDSVLSGREMRRVREQIDRAGVDAEVTYAVGFATRSTRGEVDIAAELVEPPRIFSWNLMHHPELLARTCIDIDGVLCRDPSDDVNGDGPEYSRFISQTRPLFVPSSPVRYVVTSRLEKYRAETEQWLARHGIRFEQLVMMDLEDAAERRRLGSHGRHKAAFYAASDTDLFVESDYDQAVEIAALSGRQVFAVDRREMVYPSPARALAAAPAPLMRSVGRLPPVQALERSIRARVPRPVRKLVRAVRTRPARG
jgi:uncharacterized HAD superfamily protein/orotate phosphoribosyltransferase